MTLDRLYKTSAKGATQVIDMEIIGDTYTRSWGQLDGAMQTKSTTAKPKNVGRANETTAEEQAILEAEAVWTKKQKANYSKSQDAPVLVNLPMKVNPYQKHMKKIIFPCFTSAKLNGVNGEYRLLEDGELVLLSRGGENYPIPPHQIDDIMNIMKALNTTSLNGEMYIHGEHLQDIMSATKKHNELTHKLVFWIFDFPVIEGTYAERCEFAYAEIAKLTLTAVAVINVGVARSFDELDEQHAEVTEKGFEGIMIRNAAGLYKYNTRSLDVFKYKTTQDAEFLVTGHNIDKNGHAVFECECDAVQVDTTNGIFKVKLKGTNEERLAMAAIADSYHGKFLKTEFEMLSKDGIPLKPVGIMFRKVDADGEAIE